MFLLPIFREHIRLIDFPNKYFLKMFMFILLNEYNQLLYYA